MLGIVPTVAPGATLTVWVAGVPPLPLKVTVTDWPLMVISLSPVAPKGSAATALTVTVPLEFAVRSPVVFMVAPEPLAIDQVTAPFVAFDGVVSSMHRQKGFVDCMHDHDLEIEQRLINNLSINSKLLSYDYMVRIMNSPNPPTAAFLAHDIIAIKGMSAINALGLSVPNDISIAGFDDIAMAEFTNPPLTTIKHPAFTKGLNTARVFLDYLEDKAPLKTVLMDHEFIQRESTGVCRE